MRNLIIVAFAFFIVACSKNTNQNSTICGSENGGNSFNYKVLYQGQSNNYPNYRGVKVINDDSSLKTFLEPFDNKNDKEFQNIDFQKNTFVAVMDSIHLYGDDIDINCIKNSNGKIYINVKTIPSLTTVVVRPCVFILIDKTNLPIILN